MEKLILNIFEENIQLLDVSELSDQYLLQKLYDWQEEYDWVEWEEFKGCWFFCDTCKGYSYGSCICYSR